MIGDADSRLAADARRIAELAWPVLVGQLAVLGFSTVDTLLVGRYAAADMAAFAVGASIYITVFIGLMGVVLAIGPTVGQLYGAKRLAEAGHQMHQCVWLALALSAIGSSLLAFPQPFLALSRATPEVADKISGYLLALAFSLPASLLFTVYRGFNNAVSRPKAVMVLQLLGLAAKVPLSSALVFGLPSLGLPALGVTGCGVATMIAMWSQLLLAWVVLHRDPFYARFGIYGHGLARPHRASLLALLRLGVPMGLTILIEVTAFAFMAIFIARLGTTAVAGHQIAANLVSVMFMWPLALSSATSTLVAQRVGANDIAAARRIGWRGVHFGLGSALVLGGVVFAAREGIVALYTNNAAVAAAALPLLTWVAVFHLGDALQAITASVLRAWRITVVSFGVFAVSMWGVGLAGGYALAFGHLGPALGAPGFWLAATAGLLLAGVVLAAFLAWMLKQRRERAAPLAGQPSR
ncbi:MAG: MATE family efflux transporter [Burkholderiaceae bacterium]